MTRRIAVRLPDDLAAAVEQIATARRTDRSSLVVAALRREVRREQQLRDIAILAATGGSAYPDLEDAIAWTAVHPAVVD